MSAAAQIISFKSPQEIESSLSATIAHLQSHRILAYPTETVYGLGGSIDDQSVNTLLALKNRQPNKPILLLISNIEMLSHLDLHLTPQAKTLATHFWPGPLTLVIPGSDRHIPQPLCNPQGGVAVRWTPHPGLLRLIATYGAPITSTSANPPGAQPAMSAADIATDWHRDIATGLIRVLDGGTLPHSPSSTIVDCIGSLPRVIRPGAIPVATLREVTPNLISTT